MDFVLVRRVVSVAALLCAAVLSVPAHAIVIVGNTANASESPPTGSNFSANFIYNPVSSTSATLTIDLTNTSAPTLGGFLTAFAFNNPVDAISASSLTATPSPSPFTQLGLGDNTVDAQPFGHFDLGASATGGTFQGGGAPNGIAPGATGHFVFGFTGTGLDALTADSFVSALSVGPGDGKGDQFFVARFRGLTGQPDSDKVPGMVFVPEPSTYASLFAGLGVLLFMVRRLRS
jgi:hypothetical protein